MRARRMNDVRRLSRWLPALIWSAVVLYASTDAGSSVQTGGRLERLVVALIGRPLSFEAFEILHVAIRKLMHLVAYGIEGVLWFHATRRFGLALGLTLAVASIDELNQSFNATRSGLVSDVVLDMIGALIAIWLLRRLAPELA